MFDVVWANPERELVGQRKARKEREKERRETYSSEKQSSTRSVASTETEASSLRSRKPQSFLESIRLKKVKKHSKQDASSLSTGSRLSTFSENNNNIENRNSILPPPSLASSLGRSTMVQFGDGDGSITIPQLPPLTPITSPKLLHSPPTPKSMASTRRRKKKASPPELQIDRPGNLPRLDSFTSSELRPLSLQSSSTSWMPGDGWDISSSPAPLRVVKSPKSPMSPININRYLPGTTTTDTTPSSTVARDEPSHLLGNLSGMQQEILQMAAADQDTFWLRLTEEWGAWADAALYQELETERKRWLLSALYSINRLPDTGLVQTSTAERRILAFFESQATASYIAALNASAPVYHMAPSPLSNKLFPNMVSMPANGPISSTSLSTTPHKFSHIYAQPLPVLVSASDIPRVLRTMHHALMPQGTLHLLLIDPAPAKAAMGPRLQAWLDEHLLLNLERLFRCTSPTRLFPTWLRDAHFQVGTDAKVVCTFPAIFESDNVQDATAAATATATLNSSKVAVSAINSPKDSQESTNPTVETERATDIANSQKETQQKKQRLQSLVGQKLWQEMWGPYVTAARWWWEDEACREECLRLQTVWEYHIIDAVKKERYISSQL